MYIYCIYIYVYLYTYIYINTCSPGFLTLSLVVVLMLSLPQSSLSYFLCLSLSLVLSRSLSFPLAVGNTCLQLGRNQVTPQGGTEHHRLPLRFWVQSVLLALEVVRFHRFGASYPRGRRNVLGINK